MNDLNIAVILGSTRPERKGDQVARWIIDQAQGREATYELVDLRDHPLPLYDEQYSPTRHIYEHEHTKAWAATIAQYDGYILVSPEYNHSTSAVLKNALDYVYAEWNNKAAALVTYGTMGGTRAAEHLRQILGELKVADIRASLAFSFVTDFENFSVFAPAERHIASAQVLFTDLEAWAGALKSIRVEAAHA